MDSYKVEISPHALKQLELNLSIAKCKIIKIYLLSLLKIPRHK